MCDKYNNYYISNCPLESNLGKTGMMTFPWREGWEMKYENDCAFACCIIQTKQYVVIHTNVQDNSVTCYTHGW